MRFFHGYYPSEIAQVLRSNRLLVTKWLSLARHEARAYVEHPESLKLIGGKLEAIAPRSYLGSAPAEFLSELRRTIFQVRDGTCLSEAALREIYASDHPGSIGADDLSHMVSCAHCLDVVNRVLGNPTLAERFPMETFGNDPRPRGGRGPDDKGGTGMSSGGNIDQLKQLSRRRMRDVLEHRPKELRVAVNGYLLGSQSVSAESNKLALSVQMADRVGFVEVFSEQGVCLMFSSVGAPPDGALEQEAHLELSEGRTLDLNLNFSGPWPTVNVVYVDPTLATEGESSAEVESPKSKVQSPKSKGEGPSSFAQSWRSVGHDPQTLV